MRFPHPLQQRASHVPCGTTLYSIFVNYAFHTRFSFTCVLCPRPTSLFFLLRAPSFYRSHSPHRERISNTAQIRDSTEQLLTHWTSNENGLMKKKKTLSCFAMQIFCKCIWIRWWCWLHRVRTTGKSICRLVLFFSFETSPLRARYASATTLNERFSHFRAEIFLFFDVRN